ncbi:MAG: 4-(cytidine 5'-diphospho)-2-C-methyl-D-erythritol kinase [Planctomycetes bacterium]|nr:4-(cytidine 5'-diphospho)-2-C-methyl-D-erythritol kinase [Planctomycetota bacterium]MCK5472411.1 4-(cytidine 5'-diphospho)-2-C-methyl-D-erythritol kinase [Planctomycetota bacterium]
MENKKQFENVGDALLVRAPAKINLSLLIAGKRPDGFHEIETIMAKINLYDEILIEKSQKKGIELVCTGKKWAPQNKDNLVYKAAEMLLENCSKKANLKITLKKNIPAGTGLGSASSDAAATLIGIQKFLKLTVSSQEIHAIAAQLGSDIPFFLGGPMAFCTGKGEKIKQLHKIFDFQAILILPNVSVSTKTVYANYEDNNKLYKELNVKINDYIRKNRIDLIVKMCANMLEVSCFNLNKELAELKFRVESSGIKSLCLSGSGSAMFFIIEKNDGENDGEKLGKCQNISNQISGCETVFVRNNKW